MAENVCPCKGNTGVSGSSQSIEEHPLPWIAVVLHSWRLAHRLCGGDGQPHVRPAHAGIYPDAHHRLWLWATTHQPSGLASGGGQVAEAASTDGVASCWPRGVHWLLILYRNPEAAPWAPAKEAALQVSLLYSVPRQQTELSGGPRQEAGHSSPFSQTPRLCGSAQGRRCGYPHRCISPTSSPLSASLFSPGIFLSSLKQENWLFYQHSFIQSYCFTYCLCQEFQNSLLKLKS